MESFESWRADIRAGLFAGILLEMRRLVSVT